MHPGLTDTDCRIAELRYHERLAAVHRQRSAGEYREPGSPAVEPDARRRGLAALAIQTSGHLLRPGRRFRVGAAH